MGFVELKVSDYAAIYNFPSFGSFEGIGARLDLGIVMRIVSKALTGGYPTMKIY
jgi:hypothetical protein